MKIINFEIATLLENLLVFSESDKYVPMKLGFCVNKNIKILTDLLKEIEKSKNIIYTEYGTTEDGITYTIPKDNVEIAQKELNDLAMIEQEIPIQTVKYSLIENLELTMQQISSIMFMIEEDNID